MEAKTCTRCGLKKAIVEFAWKDKDKGRRHSYCKICFREISKQQYYKKHAYYLAKAARQRKNQIKVLRQIAYDYLKNHACVDCGEKDPVCLDFDHVSGSKRNIVSRLISSAISREELLKEISKCDVRCANCHRKRTAREQHWYQDLS